MNRDINDIKIEYRDIMKKAITLRGIYCQDYIDLVRMAYHRYEYLQRTIPEYHCPMSSELDKMVEEISARCRK